MKLLGISSLIAFSFIMISCEKEALLHPMISTEFVDGSSNYTELVIPDYIETVFIDGEIHLRSATLIVSVFSPDSVVQCREIVTVKYIIYS